MLQTNEKKMTIKNFWDLDFENRKKCLELEIHDIVQPSDVPNA